MINISDLILLFRDLIILGFPVIQKIDFLEEEQTGESSFQADYAQIFLEHIIERFSERQLGTEVSLPPYALDGASIYPDSFRAFAPEREITHEINCLPKNNDYFFDARSKKNVSLIQDDQFLFCRFVTRSESKRFSRVFERDQPPFDYVICIDKNAEPNSGIEVVLELNSCDFYVRQLTKEFSTSYKEG